MAGQQVKDEGAFGKYFHVMLNMVDDDLDPFEYRLLGHYRRVCGVGGYCNEAIETTAAKCKMSLAKARETRKALRTAGFIRYEDKTGAPVVVTLVDRTAENIARYEKMHAETPTKNDRASTPIESDRATPTKNDRPPLSDSIDKEEPIKNHKEEPSISAKVTIVTSRPVDPLGQEFDEQPIPPKQAALIQEAQSDRAIQRLQETTLSPLVKAFEEKEKVPPKRKARVNVPPNPVVWLGGGRYVGPFKSMAAAQRYSAGHGTVTDLSAVPAGEAVEPAPGKKPKAAVPPPGEGVLDALVGLCYPDVTAAWKLPRIGGRVRAVYNTLATCCAPITREKIGAFSYAWYANDFRGQKKQRPKLEQIPEAWLVLMTGDDDGRHPDAARNGAGGRAGDAGMVAPGGKPGDEVVERFPEGGFRTADGREFRPAKRAVPNLPGDGRGHA